MPRPLPLHVLGTHPSVVDKGLRVFFHIHCPAITSYPAGNGSFGRLSHVHLKVMPKGVLFPEDLVELVDRHAPAPVYSSLAPEDQAHVMKRISEQRETSVVMADGIKTELARTPNVSWYFLNCDNFGMLHMYNTAISTEKSYWVPFSGIEDREI